MEGKSIILFDGVCNFCNRTVNFLIRHDKQDLFRFTPLQSDIGRQLLVQYPLPDPAPDSIILLEGHRAYFKSDAFLHIMKKLPGGWKLLSGLRVIPRAVRDSLYAFIAKRRYRWFGKRSACRIPTPETAHKFL